MNLKQNEIGLLFVNDFHQYEEDLMMRLELHAPFVLELDNDELLLLLQEEIVHRVMDQQDNFLLHEWHR